MLGDLIYEGGSVMMRVSCTVPLKQPGAFVTRVDPTQLQSF